MSEKSLPIEQLRGSARDLSPDALRRLQEEQISFILRYTPGTMIATICNGILCVVALCQTWGWTPALLWGLALIGVVTPTGWRQFSRSQRFAVPSAPAQVIRKAIINAGLLGLCWGAVPFFFLSDTYPQLQLVIACLSAGMLSGGFFALSSVPMAAIAYGAPLVVGFFVALERLANEQAIMAEALVITYVSVLLVGMVIFYNQLKGRILRQLATERELRRDPLTGLVNRRGLREALDPQLAVDQPTTLICVDIGGLSSALDRKDTETERTLLHLVASRFRSSLAAHDVLARTAEGRFFIAVTGEADDQAISRLAERIVESFSSPFEFADQTIHLTVTLGITSGPRDGSNTAALVRNAEIALHEAKQHTGRSYEFFQPQLDARVLQARKLTRDLKEAIADEQLTIVFQPIQRLASRKIVGCEALVRWAHPELGNIPPSDFIPLAEESGLIHDLGMLVLRQAVRTAKAWSIDMHVSVNVSPVQLENREFPERLWEVLVQEDFPPERLSIEITETALFRDGQLAMGSINQISELGVALSLDDFGTGYSSLNYIRHYPLSYIKIDKSFVDDVLSDPGCSAIVRGLIRMAQDLGIATVAEGVETPEQYSWLQASGCTYVQGYLISKPVSERELVPLLIRPLPERSRAAQ